MNALIFRNTTFDIVDRNGTPWLRLPQIEGALGYANNGKALNNIYTRHADEFTDKMTAVIKLQTNGGEQDVRIFSPRGCYALGMFARTKVSKEFRAWVLDVLEGIASVPNLITIAQQGEIATRIAEYFPDGKQRPMAWSRFNNHFRIASYKNLPASRFEEACAYIANIAPKELPMQKAIDVRALLTDGMSEPTVKLPDHIMQAVNQRAFAMAHEAYELSKEHLLKQIAYKCEICNPRVLAEDKALELIDKTTLGSALAHTYHTELEQAARTARYLLERVTDCHASISNALN